MPDYAVYGGVLRSTIPIPELRLADSAGGHSRPSWTFAVAVGDAPSLPAARLVAEDQIFEDVRATFFRGESGLRLQFDDTGTFDVVDADGAIVWYPKAGCRPDVARADLVGRVLPLVQHERGCLALHASAVCVADQAVAFMAPKNYGKSSLAMALVKGHAARLLTDDTLIIVPSRGVAAPGVHSVRLWSQAATQFDGIGMGRTVLSDKRIFEDLPLESLARQEARLAALYTLVPEDAATVPTVRREALDGASATMALIQYQKLGALLAGQDAARVFERAATLAGRCTVYALHIARDFARLPEAARTVAQWHAR